MRATGVNWAFAPAVAVAEDIRWGRTYESYGRDPALVTKLARSFVRGISGPSDDANRVLGAGDLRPVRGFGHDSGQALDHRIDLTTNRRR